jgi:pimeloyl-ACP methyl ester carboxylesterase
MAMTAPRAFRLLLEMSSGSLPPEDPALARQILFDADTSDESIMSFLRRVGPESPRIGAAVQGWPPIAPLPPVAPRTFVLGGRQDAIVPSDEVWRTGLYYGTQPEIVPDLGHMVMLGARWKEAAARLQDWLA